MRIEIIEDNRHELTVALVRENGKATTHTASVSDVFRLAERAERHLDLDKLPKSRRGGVVASWRAGGAAAKAYHYRMTRTRLMIRRGRRDKAWYLIAVTRCHVYPRQPEEFDISISREQRDWIVRRALEAYSMRDPG